MSENQPPPYGDPQGQPGPYGQNPYGQNPYGKPQPGQPGPYGQPQPGQPGPYGQPQPGQPGPYGQQPPPQGIFSYPGGGAQDVQTYGQGPVGMPPLANWGWRALSGLIDGVIVLVINLVLTNAISNVLGTLFSLVSIVIYGYMEGTTGQTPGKMAVGSRTLREADGQLLGAGLGIARRFLHILDTLACFVGYLWPAWDAKRQTFADKIVKSVVIKP